MSISFVCLLLFVSTNYRTDTIISGNHHLQKLCPLEIFKKKVDVFALMSFFSVEFVKETFLPYV